MSRRAFAALAASAFAGSLLVGPASPALAGPDTNPCHLPDGTLTTKSLPAGASVKACKAVGRRVVAGGLVLQIPEPGLSVGTEEMYPNDAATFVVTVAADGVISYGGDAESGLVESSSPALAAAATSAPVECGQSAYSTNDLKEYGRYDFYIGDGSFPAAMTRSDFGDKVSTSIVNIITAHNDCGLGDNVSATGSYTDYTTKESDMTNSGGYTTCGDGSTDGRDGTSTWDAGNLDKVDGSIPVAKTCWWGFPTPGAKNDLLEADVRFNITDYDFTNTPGSSTCNNHYYDVVSVGTHEAGHVYGLGHVSEVNYPTMTMSTDSKPCDSSARTLGKGDVMGLESIY